MFDELFIDSLVSFQRNSNPKASREKIANEFRSRDDKKANVLSPVEDQCRWLREIGFDHVDCYFKIFELAVFGGVKTK